MTGNDKDTVFKAISDDKQKVTCPDCGLSFSFSRATKLGENVVLCPICGARLRIE